MLRAFVIMPFEAGFAEIYSGFVKPTLESAGYEVLRADDLQDQHQILKDIVSGLAKSDLIVADLSDSNSNVYYELGIAHGLRRPVILLTQDIDELPFDLRPYRAIPYSTFFAHINEAQVRLKETAIGARTGGVAFSNPVSDFLPGPPVEGPVQHPSISTASTPATPDEDGEKGLFDHFVQLSEALDALTLLLTTNNARASEIAAETRAATELLLNVASQSPASDLVRNQREVLSQLGDSLQKYAEGVEERNVIYAETLDSLEESLGFILSYSQAMTPEAQAKREEFREVLRTSMKTMQEAIAATESLTESIRTTPSLEKRFNRARQSTVRALRRHTDNIKLTMAVLSRALELGDGGNNAP
jgi:hypothetical protein